MKYQILILSAAALVLAGCGTRSSESPREMPVAPELISVLNDAKSLTKEESARYAGELSVFWKDSVKYINFTAFERRRLTIGSNTMKLWWTGYGDVPADGRSLVISLHGGGGTTSDVNDQQWNNQKRLYQPTDAIYLCPRAIQDTWDLHFVKEADAFYEEIIHYAVADLKVNPNKVYIMGYSAGGDGVWRLAPRLADHWAAASMMAGHPGDVSLVNLRNTPFAIWCGAEDSAYERNLRCAERIVEMDALQAADPEGYVHDGHIVEGKEHWMDLEDAAAVPWMQQFIRNPFPAKIVWKQEEVLRNSFYWIGVPPAETARGKEASAHVEGNTIIIDNCDYTFITLYLNDALLDLDKPVKVVYGDKVLFSGNVTRTPADMRRSMRDLQDIARLSPVVLQVNF